MAQIHVERTIAASPERVLDWLLDPINLTVSPIFRKAVWSKDSPGPGVGAMREVTGIGFWAREQIPAYDPPRTCSYLAVRSFPVSGRAGGKVLEVLTLPLIRSLAFRKILAGCAKALESSWLRLGERHPTGPISRSVTS